MYISYINNDRKDVSHSNWNTTQYYNNIHNIHIMHDTTLELNNYIIISAYLYILYQFNGVFF